MAPLDWGRIMKLDLQTLQDNEAESEEIYNLLTKGNFDTSAAQDEKKMEKLFILSQMMLKIKATEATIASEEIERMAETHNDKVERLQSEVRQLRKHTGGGEQSFIREINILEDRNRELERAIGNSERQVIEERRNNDEQSRKIEQFERQNKELKREVERCKTDIADYHRQIEQHRDSLMSQHGGDPELRSKLNEKNKDLNRYLDEIRSLADTNSELEEKLQSVQQDLEESAIEMNKMTDEYTKLKTVLQQTDMIVEEMRKERDVLRAQVQDLRDRVASKTDNDDQILTAVDMRVEEWKMVIASKDDEIVQYQKAIEDLRKQAAATQIDADKQTIVELRQELKEKNEHVESLEQQLKDVSNEMKEITGQIEDIKNQADKGLPSAFQQKQINELHTTVNREKLTAVVERNRVKMAEKAVADKDKEVNELVAKLMQYERGEYGLSQAVQEIKDLKANLRMRDGKIEGLTKQVNELGISVNDVETENEELRERLGLDPKEPLDTEAIKERKLVKNQQQAALNRVLSKEIERLEEERLQLKRKLRKQALHRGQRAVELGLTVEDLAVAERSDEEDNMELPVTKTRSEPALSSTKADQLEANNKRLKEEIKKQDKNSDGIQTELKRFKKENKELKAENHQLEVGLREVLGQLRENPMLTAAGGDVLLRVPALEKLIAMFECRSATGQYDVHVELRASIEQLMGRNEELRNEILRARDESTGLALLVDRKNTKIAELEEEAESYREAGDGIIKIQPLVLPEGMTPSSTEVISCLNEYLTQTIQECSLKETMLQKLEDELENFKRKFAVITHQKGILYREYLDEKNEFENQRRKCEEENTELKRLREQDSVRILELDRLLENLATDPDTLKTRVGELTRKITVLRVNEKSLARRYTAMQEVESSLRRENEKLKRDIVDMEGSVEARLGYLERHKEMATYKMAVLQRSLDESCPSCELDSANREFNELTAKYRDLLQRENTLVERSSKLESLESDIIELRTEREKFLKELGNEKERCHTMEQTLGDLIGKGGGTGASPVRAEEINSIARKLATLEIKELNERQRADHASKRYEQIRGMMQDIEERNGELERRVSELTKLNIESQRIERELRSELDGAVSKEFHEASMKRAKALEESETKTRVEMMRLKEVAEVASHQAEAIQAQQESRDKELMSLRKQLYDLQMENDDRTIIGKLHHHIVALQVSEGMAIKKFETAKSKVSKLEAHILRLEQKLDDKDQILYHAKLEARNKARYLKQTIQDLRRQFSGSLPLLKQQKFAEGMRSLHESKMKLQDDLDKAKDEREEASSKMAELQLKHKNLEELLGTLRDGKGAAKVVEWHKKMEEIRLEDLKLNRTVTKLHEQVKYLENLNKSHENSLLRLEEENVRIAKHHVERQLLWDQREVELERTVDKMEKQQEEFAKAAHRFEEATGSVPDPNLPVANQLEEAIRRIKEHVKIIIGSRQENKNLKQQVAELKAAIGERETKTTRQTKVINELRLRLPVNERVAITEQVESVVTRPQDYEARKALQVAQSTIGSLQQMIRKKEESILKYQELLKEARDDLVSQTTQHKGEIKVLHDRLNLEADEALRKFKAIQMEAVNSSRSMGPGNKELRRLSELEEMVAEQENALAVAAERFKRSKDEMGRLKVQHEDEAKALCRKYEEKEASFLEQIKGLRTELELREQNIREMTKENEVLTTELEAAKEANTRAPTRAMKSLVERLRNQLMIKDREQKKLSKALMELRADMVSAAEENLRAHTQQVSEEVNVQMVVERETGDLRGRVEGLQTRLEKMKGELRRSKEKEENLRDENTRLKKDLEKKKAALVQMAELNEEKEDQKFLAGTEQKLREERKRRQEAEQRVKECEKQLGRLTERNNEKEDKEPEDDNEKQVRAQKVDEEVKKWEEGKKWQQKVETLRGKLAEKTKELEKSEKSLTMCREALARNDRERASFQTKLKIASNVPIDTTALHRDEVIQDLKQKLFDIENENQQLQHRLALEGDVRQKELELENQDLKERIGYFEAELQQNQSEKVKEDVISGQLFQDVSRRNKSLQRQLLEVKKENMELQFSFEQAKKENPRLKARVTDLQEYVEILKSELEACKKREKTRKKNMGSGMGGQSVEDMERVIAAMRRVVERLQTENDNLKKHPGSSQPELNEMTKENKKLKQELRKLKQSTHGTVKNNDVGKNSTKLMSEHEKLRKDLAKEVDETKKLKIKQSELENTVSKKQDEINELKRNLSDAENRAPNLEGLDSKQWKSAVATRMFEQKIKSLEAELEKKSTILKDIKGHVKGAADRESSLLKMQTELEEKVAILERFPSNIQLDSDLVKELQDARVRLSKVEADRDQLHNDLKRLREMSVGDNLPTNMDRDDVMQKLANYDNTLRDNVELETRLKTADLERSRLNIEVIKLRKELESFDPAFFEEIEDLKYNFQKAVERNVLYERQLRELSRQFGVDINIPGDDDI